MTDQDITRCVAVYGAVVATVTAIWKIYTDLRDKGRLKIELTVGRMLSASGAAVTMTMTPEGPVPINLSDRDRIFMTVTNVGRRPIKVAKVGGFQGARFGINRLGLRRQGFIVYPHNLPRMLEPGDSVTEWMDDPKDIEPVRVMYVWDSTGRGWRVPRRVLGQTKRRVREPERPADAAGPSADQREEAVRAGRELFGESFGQP